MQKATLGNLAEIGAGQIAGSLAFRDSVKLCGSMMIGDHSTAQLSLDSIADQWNIALPSVPDSAHVAMAATLRELSGAGFDSTYLSCQIADHDNAKALYQNEIEQGSNTTHF